MDRRSETSSVEECKQLCQELHREISEAPGNIVSELNALKTDPELKLTLAAELKCHFGKIVWVDWLADSQRIMIVARDGNFTISNLHSRRPKLAVPVFSPMMTCSASPSMALGAVGGLDNMVSLYSLETGDRFAELQEHEGYISHCKFIDDFSIVSCSGDATVVIWDVELAKQKFRYEEHKSDVSRIDIFENKFVFLSGSCDREAKLWDARDSSNGVSIYQGKGEVCSVKILPGDKAAGILEEEICYLIDLRTHKILNEYKSKSNCYGSDLDFSKSGKHLFISYHYRFAVWDTATAECIIDSEKAGRVQCVSRSPDDRHVAIGGSSRVAQIYSMYPYKKSIFKKRL